MLNVSSERQVPRFNGRDGFVERRSINITFPHRDRRTNPQLLQMLPVANRARSFSFYRSSDAVPVNEVYRDVGQRFGVRLRELRRQHRMTQIDMAVGFGIDRSYISDIECGKKGISLATLEVIAIGFHLKLADLLRDI
jgi:DNA-binding XRE family transcriptional regulator